MWTKAQVRAFQNGLNVAQKWEEPLNRLAEIAKHAPAFAERVEQLKAMREALYQVSATAVAVDPEGQ